MKPAFILFTIINVIYAQNNDECKPNEYRTYAWSRYTTKNVNPNGMELVIFCYNNTKRISPLFRAWSSAKFSVDSHGEVELYSGKNITDVACQHQSKANLWLQKSFDFWKSNSVWLNPFESSCVGVLSKDNYDVTFFNKILDLRLFLAYLIAIILFLISPLLSRNIVCYYGTGVSIGLLASLLILALVFGRFVPKKSVFYSIFVACFSVSAYIWNFLYGNFLMLVNNYHHFILIYISVVSLISFAFCYYKGPISNPRVFKLIEWALQLISITIIYFATNITSVCISTVLCLIIFTNLRCPNFLNFHCPNVLNKLRNRLMPPTRKLLTIQEYEEEGEVETRKALEDLRKFCNSPDCNAWKTVSRLKSPSKFAEWVESDDDHVQNELLFDSDEDDDADYQTYTS